jgi:hypothetical protein
MIEFAACIDAKWGLFRQKSSFLTASAGPLSARVMQTKGW